MILHHSNHRATINGCEAHQYRRSQVRVHTLYTYLLFSFALQEQYSFIATSAAPIWNWPIENNKTLHTFPAVWRLHSICGTSEILAAVVVNDIINLMNRLHFFIRMSISTASLQYGQAEKNIPTIRQTYIICMHAWTYSCWGPDVDVTQQHPQHPETPKLFWVALFLK